MIGYLRNSVVSFRFYDLELKSGSVKFYVACCSLLFLRRRCFRRF